MKKPQNLVLGVSLAIISTILYSSLNAMVATHVTLSVPVLVFIQSAMTLILFLPLLLKNGISSFKKITHTHKIPLHILRTVLTLLVSYLLFSSVKYIPLVNAMLLTNTAPLLVPFVAFLFLSQKINHKMWIPILIGFAGVAIVLNPDARIFHPAAFLALGSAVALAASIVVIRKLTLTDSSETITFYFFLLSTVISGGVAILFWEPVTISWGPLLAMGLLYFGSQYLYTAALSYANVQLIGSLLYTNIINTTILSALLWHIIPTPLMLVGICLTIMGGVACILTDRKAQISEALDTVVASPLYGIATKHQQ